MGKHSVSYPVQEFMLKTDTLKNGMAPIGLYGSASPLGVVFIVQTKKCTNCKCRCVGLHSEMRVIQTNGSRTWISFIWILSPQSFCISDCHCFTHHSLCCQSFIGIPKTYIQYNPTNLNPLGEYELG